MQSGNWNNGVHCGLRAVNVNNYPWNRNTNIGVRLACDNSLCTHKEGIVIMVSIPVVFHIGIILPIWGKYGGEAPKGASHFWGMK
jgi:hypothetical protein